eukprot:s936_g7.t1
MTSASHRPSALRNGGSTKSRGRSPVRKEKREKKEKNRDRDRKKTSETKEAAEKRRRAESGKKTEEPKSKKSKDTKVQEVKEAKSDARVEKKKKRQTEDSDTTKKTDEKKETKLAKKTGEEKETKMAKKTGEEKETKVAKKTDEEKETKMAKKTDEKKETKSTQKTDENKETKSAKKTDENNETKSSEMKATDETQKSKKEKKGKKDKKSKKEPPIKFQPAVAQEIEHIFETPPRKPTRAPSPCPSVAASSKGLTSREKAEKRLQELAAVLNSSDLDDDSCPATDLEQFMEDAKMASDSESGSEEEEEGEERMTMETKDEDEDADDKSEDSDSHEEAKEGSGSEDASSDGQGEEVSEEESEYETETEEEEEEEEQDERDKGDNKDKEKDATKVPDEKEQHALVPVTQETASNQVALRNSMTNKNEWDKFCRSAKGKMPAALSDYYQSSKVELFNLWLDAGHDWSKTQMQVERVNQQKHTAQRGWVAIQGKELKKRYTEEKWEQVKESRKKAGLYYQDDDFPDDDDDTSDMINECWFFTKEGQKFTRKDTTGESMKLQSKKDVDPDMRAALVDSESGLMRAGALPKVSTASAAGSKALLDAIEKVTAAPKKKKTPDEDNSSKPVEPATLAEKVAAALPTVLKDSSDARTASIKLGTTEYAGELAKQLLGHAQKLEKLYTKMSEAISPGSSAKDKDLKVLVMDLETLTAFGNKAQAAADAFLKPKKAKAPKGKATKKKEKTQK